MRDHQSMLKRLTEGTDLCQELIPGTPLIEITGTSRVYIENHRKIFLYTETEIHIGVKYGMIVIEGEGLTFSCIAKEYLVVTGHIFGVHLEGSRMNGK